MSDIEIGEHVALVIVAMGVVCLGAFAISCGVDGVLLGGLVAILASIAGFIVGRGQKGPPEAHPT